MIVCVMDENLASHGLFMQGQVLDLSLSIKFQVLDVADLKLLNVHHRPLWPRYVARVVGSVGGKRNIRRHAIGRPTSTPSMSEIQNRPNSTRQARVPVDHAALTGCEGVRSSTQAER